MAEEENDDELGERDVLSGPPRTPQTSQSKTNVSENRTATQKGAVHAQQLKPECLDHSVTVHAY